MRTCAVVLLSLAMGACALKPPETREEQVFADHLFRAPSQPIDAAQVFAVSKEMKDYLANDVGMPSGPKGRQRALAHALRSNGNLRLEYDAEFTRNAAEAFASRSGNCLSLVIMTAALAKQMGIRVSYHNVRADETWSRQGDLYFSIGHVNVTLGGKPPTIGTRIDDGEQLTVDFLPVRDLGGLLWRVVEENTIIAMYMNNRAAEELATGNLDDAYWYAREAIRHDPEYITLYNTLGVIYLRGGHLARAHEVLAYGLRIDTRNTNLMSNMVAVLAKQGRVEESRDLERRVAQIDPDPPFAWFNRGLAAMKAGNYRAARDLFAKEVDRAPYYHEFHFWMAMALVNLGETQQAREQLALAMENSTTRKDHQIYATKLERIKASQPH